MTASGISGEIPNRKLNKIMMPLPDTGFDPTEAAIPWEVCTSRGWQVEFATEHGIVSQGDAHKLTGPLSGLFSAGAKTRSAYQKMERSPHYQHPYRYEEIDPDQYIAILLPGGDRLEMRPYLESAILQDKVLRFWQQGKLIGAICHGLLLLARTIDPLSGHSVIYGRKVTATPKSLDRLAYRLDKMTVKYGYLMYSNCVADEVRSCLKSPVDFSSGPGLLAPYVVTDGNLITARWYMDAELFGTHFADKLEEQQ